MNNPYLELKNINVIYKPENHSVKDFSLVVERNKITSIIGTKECGKTSLLRSINRLHDLYPNVKVTGDILLEGESIFKMNPIEVRRRIGTIFKNPSPFPNINLSDNVLAFYKFNKIHLNKNERNEIVEKCLTDVGLWKVVKDQLKDRPKNLTKCQQQLLCIARVIAAEPEIILMDEPTLVLDVVATTTIENLIYQLKNKCTILLATQDISQSARISDFTLYMEKGEAIEYGTSSELYWNPRNKRTENFINIQTH